MHARIYVRHNDMKLPHTRYTRQAVPASLPAVPLGTHETRFGSPSEKNFRLRAEMLPTTGFQ